VGAGENRAAMALSLEVLPTLPSQGELLVS
jgi:hypothetical protein